MSKTFYPLIKIQMDVFRKFILVFVCASLVSGCAAFSQLRKESYEDDNRLFTASVPVGWMRYNFGKEFLITRDGIVLNAIAVSRRKLDEKLDFTKKKFTTDMLPQDLAEVELDDLKSVAGINRFTLLSNEPATLDGRSGFRVEYGYYTQSGLKMRGIRYGFLEKEWIYRIRYEAPTQHYFQYSLKDFKKFMESFKTKQK